GHTGSDSVIFVPDARVAFTGDLFWHNNMPNLVDASTEAWIRTLDQFVDHEPGWTFVPGHGDVGRVEDVIRFRDYLTTLRTLVGDAQARGRAVDDSVMAGLTEHYGRWAYFQDVARQNIAQMDAELRGIKRVPST